MRIVVDLDRCDSHGQCALAAPEIFAVGDDDLVRVLDEHPPDRLRPVVTAAAQRCPKLAIDVVDG
ncbi:ferredoxin [Luedemannella helvata]|uniref:Ferredoxin n=1 Tax=Luedemannella helvata TaxID=349315 RepID=A0ABP4X443_9ACTN